MKEVLEYIVDKVNNTPVMKVPDIPYYYLYNENVWPPDFYDEILKNIPDKSFYRPLSKMYSNRFIYELAYGENVSNPLANFSGLGDDKRSFWKEFQIHFILNPLLANTYLEKYKDHIHWDTMGKMGLNCRLSKDMKEYSIGVHSDRRNKVFSTLFYLPPKNITQDLAEHWGTDIMKPKVELVHDARHHAYNKDGSHDLFELYKTVPAHPGAMFSWCVTQQSYHGVNSLTIEGERDSIAFFGKVSKNDAENRVLLGEGGFK